MWLGCGFITIKSLSYICCIFKHHLLSEIKYSSCSHDAGLTDWSENQLCPQTLPVLMEPLNMDSLNKATSSEGACASLSEGSTSEPHNSAFGTQHPCREKHFQLLTLQREQPYTHQKVVPTDLLTCSGARPGKGIRISSSSLRNRPEVYDFDESFPNKSVYGRGSVERNL